MNKDKFLLKLERKYEERKKREARWRVIVQKTEKKYKQSLHHYKELCHQANENPDPKLVKIIKLYISYIERGCI